MRNQHQDNVAKAAMLVFTSTTIHTPPLAPPLDQLENIVQTYKNISNPVPEYGGTNDLCVQQHIDMEVTE